MKNGLLTAAVQGDTKAERALAAIIRQGGQLNDKDRSGLVNLVGAITGLADGDGNPDDLDYLSQLLEGLNADATSAQREKLACLLEKDADKIDDDADHAEAIRAAKNGNPAHLIARRDQGKRADFPAPRKRGRKVKGNAAVEAFLWLTEVEGIPRARAIDAVWIAEGKHRERNSVTREIDDKRRDGFKMEFPLDLYAQWWREGRRDDEFRPVFLRHK